MIEVEKQIQFPTSNQNGTYFDYGAFRITVLDLVTFSKTIHHVPLFF